MRLVRTGADVCCEGGLKGKTGWILAAFVGSCEAQDSPILRGAPWWRSVALGAVQRALVAAGESGSVMHRGPAREG